MENKQTLLADLRDTFSALEKAIQRFDEASFNEKPAQSNWSPAMVAQHLILAGTDFDKLLLGNTKPTLGQADEKVAQLQSIFLDFDAKMTSPEFIEPADQNYQQELQRSKLNDIGNAIINVVPDLDLTLTCTDFEMPYMGHLTRLELISFVIFHTQRHTQQLEKMSAIQ